MRHNLACRAAGRDAWRAGRARRAAVARSRPRPRSRRLPRRV